MIASSGELVLDRPAEQVAQAFVHATAHGIYELLLAGAPVTDSVFNPGWTAYEWRLQYQSFDVTDLLRASGGTVPVQARVGNGWYRGAFGFENLAANHGEEIGLLAAVLVESLDGSRLPADIVLPDGGRIAVTGGTHTLSCALRVGLDAAAESSDAGSADAGESSRRSLVHGS